MARRGRILSTCLPEKWMAGSIGTAGVEGPIAGDKPIVFRVSGRTELGGPDLLLQVCLDRGWSLYDDENHHMDDWNLWWRNSHFPLSQHRLLQPWQFVNHIPRANSICRKDCLTRHLQRMQKIHGSIYNFSPLAFNLPQDYTKLANEYTKLQDEGEDALWICKPVGQSQGKGITIFQDLNDLTYDTSAVVQRYISNPRTIAGYKFDLRIYVSIPSYHPLAIYIYDEGLVRFGTEKFNLLSLDNKFSHLTNTSLNKQGPSYGEEKERIGSGCKWTLSQLRHYFYQTNTADWLLWQRINTIVTLTVLCQIHDVPPTRNCFELYGFDILVDDNMRPWLMEVNLSPSLTGDCDVDIYVKKPLLNDLYDLVGLPTSLLEMKVPTRWPEVSIDPRPTSVAEIRAQLAGKREQTTSSLIEISPGTQKKKRDKTKATTSDDSSDSGVSLSTSNGSNHDSDGNDRRNNTSFIDDEDDDDSSCCVRLLFEREEESWTSSKITQCILNSLIDEVTSSKNKFKQRRSNCRNLRPRKTPSSSQERCDVNKSQKKKENSFEQPQEQPPSAKPSSENINQVEKPTARRNRRSKQDSGDENQVVRRQGCSVSDLLLDDQMRSTSLSALSAPALTMDDLGNLNLNNFPLLQSSLPSYLSCQTHYVAPKTYYTSSPQLQSPWINKWRRRVRERELLRPRMSSDRSGSGKELLLLAYNWHSFHNKWGNGRDWRFPPARVGGWVRTFPFNEESQEAASEPIDVKAVITEVQAFYRVAKRMVANRTRLTNEQLSRDLRSKFWPQMEIWTPCT